LEYATYPRVLLNIDPQTIPLDGTTPVTYNVTIGKVKIIAQYSPGGSLLLGTSSAGVSFLPRQSTTSHGQIQ
jgi:hypothetical protein